MVAEIFVKQLDGCTYHSGGENCNCAAGAMFIYRASQGRIRMTSCQVRRETGDDSGGTNLEQIERVAKAHGITGGRVYKPIMARSLFDLIRSGRYGAVLQLDYSPIANTQYDCFDGRFFGGHSVYVSTTPSIYYARAGDPGADGRRSGIPTGYQSYPISLLIKAAGMLQVTSGGQSLNQKYGLGRAFAYVTPSDPAVASPAYYATVTQTTKLWNPAKAYWVYSLAPGTDLIVRGAGYMMGGKLCYPVNGPAPYGGYFVPKANVRLEGRV